jgi:hypothetical protein
MTQRNRAASVRAKLLNHARETQQDFSLVLTRFAIERLLYRLSISSHADDFLLKGALLFDLWFDIPHRPTRDVDFLGFGSAEPRHLEAVFRDLCAIDTDDGVTFQQESVKHLKFAKRPITLECASPCSDLLMVRAALFKLMWVLAMPSPLGRKMFDIAFYCQNLMRQKYGYIRAIQWW